MVGRSTKEANRLNLNIVERPLDAIEDVAYKFGGVADKLESIDQRHKQDHIQKVFAQEVEDKLEILLEKLQNERTKILSHGLMKREVIDLKMSVVKEIEVEKL